MDGARFANAVATLNCSPREMIVQAGVDVLCFGGTKNGMGMGEVIILFNKELSQEFDFQLKQSGQLCSKMRYLSAPWLGMLQDDVWLKNAQTSNAMAQRLKVGMEGIGIEVLYPVEANSLFAKLDDRLIAGMLYRGWKFVKFIAAGGCRIMCSWDTRNEDVDAFLADLNELHGNDEDRNGEVEIMSH
jgi:threonine aldolase